MHVKKLLVFKKVLVKLDGHFLFLVKAVRKAYLLTEFIL